MTTTTWSAFIAPRKQTEHGDKFDPSDLAEKFISHFESGERIRVEFDYGSGGKCVRTGRVSVTTGWKPAFLLIRRRTDRGSSTLLNSDDRITHVQQNNGKYTEA
ncbi:MAG: hypothetical protein ACRERD_14120 [Candidatus Binatia bacterium]